MGVFSEVREGGVEQSSGIGGAGVGRRGTDEQLVLEQGFKGIVGFH